MIKISLIAGIKFEDPPDGRTKEEALAAVLLAAEGGESAAVEGADGALEISRHLRQQRRAQVAAVVECRRDVASGQTQQQAQVALVCRHRLRQSLDGADEGAVAASTGRSASPVGSVVLEIDSFQR